MIYQNQKIKLINKIDCYSQSEINNIKCLLTEYRPPSGRDKVAEVRPKTHEPMF